MLPRRYIDRVVDLVCLCQVPFGYSLIYKFRKTHDAKIRGLSNLDRRTRMRLSKSFSVEIISYISQKKFGDLQIQLDHLVH